MSIKYGAPETGAPNNKGTVPDLAGLAAKGESFFSEGDIHYVIAQKDYYIYSAATPYDYQPAGWSNGFVIMPDLSQVTADIEAEETRALAAEAVLQGQIDNGGDNVKYVDASATLTADGSILKPYPTISAAVTAADEGDVIAIRAGVYTEALTITKSLSLIGEGRDTTILQTYATFDKAQVSNAVYMQQDDKALTLVNMTIRNAAYGIYTKHNGGGTGPTVNLHNVKFFHCGFGGATVAPTQVTKLSVLQTLTNPNLTQLHGSTVTLGVSGGSDVTFEIDATNNGVTAGNVAINLFDSFSGDYTSLDIAEEIAKGIRSHASFGAGTQGSAVIIRNAQPGVVTTTPAVTGNGWDATTPIDVIEDGVDISTSWALASNAGALRVQDSVRPFFRNVEILECDRGFRIQDCTNPYVLYPKIRDTLQAGIYLADSSYGTNSSKGCTDAYVYGAIVDRAANNGLLIIGGKNNAVYNSTFSDCWNSGIMLHHPADVLVFNSTFVRCCLSKQNGNDAASGDSYGGINIQNNSPRDWDDFTWTARILDCSVLDTAEGGLTRREGVHIGEAVYDGSDPLTQPHPIIIGDLTTRGHEVDVYVGAVPRSVRVEDCYLTGAEALDNATGTAVLPQTYTHQVGNTSKLVTGSALRFIEEDTASSSEQIGELVYDGDTNKFTLSSSLAFSSGSVEGTASEALKLSTARTVSLSGDVTGSTTFDGSADASIAATVGDIALGTKTTGDYVATVTAGAGLSSTGAATGEGIAHSLSVDAAQTQITEIGTITTGEWQATPISNTYIANPKVVISDGTNSSDVALGGTLKIEGTTNEVEVVESSGTVTVGLPSSVTITDLTVNGTTTTINTTNMVVADNLIGLNEGATSNANDCGIIIERGSTGDNAAIIWDESVDKFTLGTTTATPSDTGDLSVTAGTLVANIEGTVSDLSNHVGETANKVVQLDSNAKLPALDGSQLTNLPAASTTLAALTDTPTPASGDDGKVLQYEHSSTSFVFAASGGGGGGAEQDLSTISSFSSNAATHTKVKDHDIILIDTSACTAQAVITLPSASAAGAKYRIEAKWKAGSNSVKLDPSSGNIDGSATFTLPALYSAITLVSDGTDYWVV